MLSSPKCPFCERPVKRSTYAKGILPNILAYTSVSCNEESCWVEGEFPRYMELLDERGNMLSQEYALDTFYAKVYPNGTCIYRMMSCMLMDEVKIQRALWLNLTNTDATLDKLKFCVTFS